MLESEAILPKLVWWGSHLAPNRLVKHQFPCLLALIVISAIVMSSVQSGFAQEGRVCPATAESSTPIVETENGEHGIRIVDFDGDISICSENSVQVSGDSSEGIHISKSQSLLGSGRKDTTTEIRVHDVDLKTTTNGFDLSAINVGVTGNLTFHSSGVISTAGSGVHGVKATLYGRANAQSEDDRAKIAVNDLSTSGDMAIGILTHNNDAQNNKLEISISGAVATYGQGSHGVASSGNFADLKVIVKKSGSITIADPDETESKAIFILDSATDKIAKARIENAGKVDGRVFAEACGEVPKFVNSGLVFSSDRGSNKAIELIKNSDTTGPCTASQGKGIFSNENSGVSLPVDRVQSPPRQLPPTSNNWTAAQCKWMSTGKT